MARGYEALYGQHSPGNHIPVRHSA
jgi:hypothetical protein